MKDQVDMSVVIIKRIIAVLSVDVGKLPNHVQSVSLSFLFSILYTVHHYYAQLQQGKKNCRLKFEKRIRIPYQIEEKINKIKTMI
jgi:hypothetical protein